MDWRTPLPDRVGWDRVPEPDQSALVRGSSQNLSVGVQRHLSQLALVRAENGRPLQVVQFYFRMSRRQAGESQDYVVGVYTEAKGAAPAG